MKKYCLLFFVFVGPFLHAQHDRVWYFGLNAGLNFNNNPVQSITGGQSAIPDNISSISDVSGALLFYTDGVSVWNKNHQVMANGWGLTGNYTAGQTALIVPVPCSTSEYLIFHTTEFSSPGHLHYTRVNMSLNGGLGDVVSNQKNISLGTGWTEKLCAIYSPASNTYWVLTHRWNSADFVAFSVNSNGLSAQSVTTTIGSVHNCGTYSGAHDAMGQLTISRNGAKVLNALTCQDKYELFDFNMATGVLSNIISIPGTDKPWGTAFSPDNQKIYVNSIFGDFVDQYDISSYTTSAVLNSKFNLVSTGVGGYNFGYMELGPDNKIYIGKPNAGFLSVVNAPNNLGAASGFSLNGVSLGNATSTHGLSRIAYNIPVNVPPLNLSLAATSTVICVNASVTLTASGAATYAWSTGSAANSILLTPQVSTVISVTGSGACGSTATKSVNIIVTECTSLSKINTPAQMTIYPTVFSSVLTIENNTHEKRLIRMYDATGRLVLTATMESGETIRRLETGRLADGMYYLVAGEGNDVTTSKLIKQIIE